MGAIRAFVSRLMGLFNRCSSGWRLPGSRRGSSCQARCRAEVREALGPRESAGLW
jgi:hypothetical protein